VRNKRKNLHLRFETCSSCKKSRRADCFAKDCTVCRYCKASVAAGRAIVVARSRSKAGPSAHEREQTRVAAEVAKFDAMAAEFRASIGIRPRVTP
jgi:hypothetical protein